MRALLVTALLASCYQPQYAEGLACAIDRTCPPGQHCFDLAGGSMCFVDEPMPDAGAACDVVGQTDCGADQKCTVDDQGAHVCVQDGSVARGQVCGGHGALDDCMRGDVCIYKICRAACDISANTNGMNPRCQTDQTCQGATLSPANFAIGVCVDHCDPLLQNCAMAGTYSQNCYINSSAETVCLPPDESRAEGAACTANTQCMAGLGCEGQLCRKYCNWQQAPDQRGTCNAGQTCHFAIDQWGTCR